jgi:thiol-disulfide isomerase/thioredoxin
MSQRRVKRERREQAADQPPRRSRQARADVAFVVGVLVAVGGAAAGFALARSGGSGAASSPTPSSPVATSSGSRLDLSGTDPVTGKTVSLAAFAGKPIVLNMWASWCTGCYAEARALATFERAHPQAQVVGVDIQDSKSGAVGFYRKFGWTHPSIFDPSGKIAAELQLQGLPATLFLDRRHHVVAKILGETDVAGFDQGLETAERS